MSDDESQTLGAMLDAAARGGVAALRIAVPRDDSSAPAHEATSPMLPPKVRRLALGRVSLEDLERELCSGGDEVPIDEVGATAPMSVEQDVLIRNAAKEQLDSVDEDLHSKPSDEMCRCVTRTSCAHPHTCCKHQDNFKLTSS
jgi:hypothetical protein